MKKNENSHEFKPILVEIQESPLNPLGRLVFWIIITLFIILSAVVFFAKTDIVVSGYGNTFISGNIKSLKVPTPGLIKNVYVEVNDEVKKGEKLVEIDSTVTSSKHKTLRNQLSVTRMEVGLMKKLINGKPIAQSSIDNEQIKLYISEKKLLNQSIIKLKNDIKSENIKADILQSKLAYNNEDYESTKAKVDRLEKVKDLIEKSRIEDLKDKLTKLNTEKSILNKELSEVKIRVESLSSKITNAELTFSKRILEQIIAREKEIENIAHELNSTDFNSENHTIQSPVDGYVNELMINTRGSAVSYGEEILTIVPAEGEIKVKAKVLNKDIGFIENGQTCEVKVETFSFQKYGTINCEVESISKDSIDDERMGKVYELIVRLSKDYLTKGSERFRIQSGMNVTVEIKSGKRRIIELLTNPIVRGFDEGLKVR